MNKILIENQVWVSKFVACVHVHIWAIHKVRTQVGEEGEAVESVPSL